MFIFIPNFDEWKQDLEDDLEPDLEEEDALDDEPEPDEEPDESGDHSLSDALLNDYGITLPTSFDALDQQLLAPLPDVLGRAHAENFPISDPSMRDVFLHFLNIPVLNHILERTNQRMEEQRAGLGSSYKLWVLEDIYNFFAVYISLSLVRYRAIRMAWQSPGTDSPFGNTFIRSIMSRDDFLSLFHNIQADLSWFLSEFNSCAAKSWRLGSQIVFDDDLVQSMARTKQKLTIFNPKKAGKRGISSYRIVDSSHYVYYIILESEAHKTFPSAKALYSEQMVRHLLEKLPARMKFEIQTDAGDPVSHLISFSLSILQVHSVGSQLRCYFSEVSTAL